MNKELRLGEKIAIVDEQIAEINERIRHLEDQLQVCYAARANAWCVKAELCLGLTTETKE